MGTAAHLDTQHLRKLARDKTVAGRKALIGLVTPDIAAGPESLEVGLFRWQEIPWGDIAFPSVRWALDDWRETRGAVTFAARSNPPGETGGF